MKCSSCSAEIPSGAQFCPSCGSHVEPTVVACPQCHLPVNPDAIFCPSCGSRIKAAAAQPASSYAYTAPVQPAAAQPAYTQQQTPYTQPYAQQQTYTQQPFAQQQPYPQQQPYAPQPYAPQPYGQPVQAIKPRRKRKGLAIVLVVILILAVAIGGAYALFGGKIARALMGPKAAYLAIEGAALKESTDKLAADLAEYGNREAIPEKGGYDVDFQFDLDENTLGVDAATAAALENLTINSKLIFDSTGAQSRFFGSFDLAADEETLLTLETYYDEDQMIFSLPGILGQSIVATADELSSYMGFYGVDPEQTDSSMSLLASLLNSNMNINEARLASTFRDLADIMLDHIDEAEFAAKQELTAGGVTASCDLYTITITKESARQMFLEIFELLRDDEEAYNLISQIAALSEQAEYGYAADVMTMDEYQEGLDDLISQLEDDDSEDFTMVQKVYVNSEDEIIGRDLTVTSAGGDENLHILYAHPVDGSREAFKLATESDGESFDFISSFTVKDGKKTGTASLSTDGTVVLDADFEDLVKQTIGDSDKILGTVELTFPDSSGSDMGVAVPTSLSFSGSLEGGRYVMDLGIPNMIAFHIGYTELGASEVVFPSYDSDSLVSISDMEALGTLMTPDVQAQIMAILQQLGFLSSFE